MLGTTWWRWGNPGELCFGSRWLMLRNVPVWGHSWGVVVGKGEGRGGEEKKRAGTLIHLPEVWWDIHCLLFHLVLMIAWHISMLQVHNVFRARKHHLHTNWGVLFLRAAFEFQWCLCLLSHDWTEHFRLWRNNSSEGLWLMWLFFPLYFSPFFLVLFFLLSSSNLFCLGKPEDSLRFLD